MTGAIGIVLADRRAPWVRLDVNIRTRTDAYIKFFSITAEKQIACPVVVITIGRQCDDLIRSAFRPGVPRLVFIPQYPIGVSDIKEAIADRQPERTVEPFEKSEALRSVIDPAVFIGITEQIDFIRSCIG